MAEIKPAEIEIAESKIAEIKIAEIKIAEIKIADTSKDFNYLIGLSLAHDGNGDGWRRHVHVQYAAHLQGEDN
jgi:hypothetical protein